ncbi:hypothetical protein KBAH04_00520 [Aeromonas hydrophila]|nr:hypothetical protein KBAH04_00520 [Aeromonas hydrophila]
MREADGGDHRIGGAIQGIVRGSGGEWLIGTEALFHEGGFCESGYGLTCLIPTRLDTTKWGKKRAVREWGE